MPPLHDHAARQSCSSCQHSRALRRERANPAPAGKGVQLHSRAILKARPHTTAGACAVRIAIDGTNASGKSAAGSRVAARLGIPFVDTGLMYRAVTWLALQRGLPLDDAARVGALAESVNLTIGPPPLDRRETCTIIVDGQDVTPFLRQPEVERGVSAVSAIDRVRRAMVRLQREAAPKSVVMAGRDIGAVVLPDADLKIYMDAGLEVRARRRQAELAQKGRVADLDTVRAELAERDRKDQTRAVSPAVQAADAILLRTDDLTLDQVVDQITALAQMVAAGGSGARTAMLYTRDPR